jgi:2-succinyl-5-enolpyruvyl-6-hydroxy-3-cyclohexene-1-carboxylate synthase
MNHDTSSESQDIATVTNKVQCGVLADILAANGVRRVFVSPGSRNAPLIIEFARDSRFETTVVIDERSAAFMALGYAARSQSPVALLCTSGSAVLNYAPAVAEAYYRRIPLIVISADRPKEWIDQDDSQTIWQAGALANIVKQTVDIADDTAPARLWMASRLINDAMLTALDAPRGPVHINMQFDEPLTRMVAADSRPDTRIIVADRPEPVLSTAEVRALAAELARYSRVLVVVGFHEPDDRLNRGLARLSQIPSVAVMHEAQANLHSPAFLANIDTVLSGMTEQQRLEMLPQVVITAGGALVSRHVKAWLRDSRSPIQHWQVGRRGMSVDCFKTMTRRIEVAPRQFFSQLAGAMRAVDTPSSDYGITMQRHAAAALDSANRYAVAAPWSDLSAMHRLISLVPRSWDVQASNGTAVRYLQLFDYSHMHRIDANRGVSGIDGSTSTAIGAAMASTAATLLVTGDMSAQYDIAALAASDIPPTFKMAVLNNSGGGIFRFIKSTSALPELDHYFAGDVRLPLRQLAEAYGFAYHRAESMTELEKAFAAFARETERPAILDIVTPGDVSADILKRFFTRDK